jgi:methylthioxylose transferase
MASVGVRGDSVLSGFADRATARPGAGRVSAMPNETTMTPVASTAGRRPMGGLWSVTAATGVAVVAIGALGTLAHRGFGRVPFSVPAWPWYHSDPFYLFWDPGWPARWAVLALPAALAAATGVVALFRSRARPGVRVAASAGLLLLLALAVAALGGGPAAWRAPFGFAGEYPHGVGQVGDIPSFLGEFPQRLASLPSHAAGHPAGAMVLYALLARVWAGLDGAALLTVAIGCLGALPVWGLARDELGQDGGRWSLALWVLCPMTVLYTATSADAVFAVVLAGAALAAHRGLVRRSWAWTATGGALLWIGSMLTYAAVLLLVFLLVRAAGRLRRDPGWVLCWAAATAGTVCGLAGLLLLATGYDPVAAVRATHAVYQAAPGSARRPYLPWLVGDPIAFGGMLGVPLSAALMVRAVSVVRQRAWTSFDAAMLACLLAASAWGFSRGEVERIFLFLVPLALVPVVRQLWAWQARLPAVAVLLVAQTIAVQLLFYTRW